MEEKSQKKERERETEKGKGWKEGRKDELSQNQARVLTGRENQTGKSACTEIFQK